MLSKIIAATLLSSTIATVALYPSDKPIPVAPVIDPIVDPVVHLVQPPVQQSSERPKVEVVFALDTTGSMSGLIEAAKEKVWSIATTMASAQPAPEIRIGLVAYRDRGDAYVTKVIDLTSDLDSMYATLMDFRADGGGDGPESVNQALYDAVNKISWSQDQSAYKVVFLVGDAPPHMDYQGEVQYPETIKLAKQRGIVVNAIQAGQDHTTATQWQKIAQLGTGDYFQVEQGGSAVAVSTPYDKKLAELATELDDTRLFYGSKEQKAKAALKTEATKKLTEAASIESRARRATFNASASGEANLFGDSDLVSAVATGRVELEAVDEEMLPEPMKAMAPEEQQAMIEQVANRREELKREIQSLKKQRGDYAKEKIVELGEAKDDSLDVQLFETIKSQAGAKGLSYESDALEY